MRALVIAADDSRSPVDGLSRMGPCLAAAGWRLLSCGKPRGAENLAAVDKVGVRGQGKRKGAHFRQNDFHPRPAETPAVVVGDALAAQRAGLCRGPAAARRRRACDAWA